MTTAHKAPGNPSVRTVFTVFGAAMSTLFVTHELPSDIVDLTFDGGHATQTNPCIITDNGPRLVDIDQVPNLSGSQGDFAQWNDAMPATGRTMLITGSAFTGTVGNLLSIRANSVQSGDIIDPATFVGEQVIGGSAGTPNSTNTFDGSGTAYVAFRTAAGNVGWWKCQFDLQGPITGTIRYRSGRLGTDGESVVVNDYSCCDCSFKLGDVNMDGVVSLLDVDPFADALVSGEYTCEADINKDFEVDLLDVAPFIQLLTGG